MAVRWNLVSDEDILKEHPSFFDGEEVDLAGIEALRSYRKEEYNSEASVSQSFWDSCADTLGENSTQADINSEFNFYKDDLGRGGKLHPLQVDNYLLIPQEEALSSSSPDLPVYAVWETDFQHTQDSKDLRGIFTSKDLGMGWVKRQIQVDLENFKEDDSETSTQEQMTLLDRINQTQGCPRCEFLIELVDVNPIFEG